MKTSFNNYIKEQTDYFEHGSETLNQIHSRTLNVLSTVRQITEKYSNKLVKFEYPGGDKEFIVSKIECIVTFDKNNDASLLTFRFYESNKKWIQIGGDSKFILKTKMNLEDDPFCEDT